MTTKNIRPPLLPANISSPTAPTFSPLNRVDSKYIQDLAIKNTNLTSESRAFTAVVGPTGTPGVEFTDIQEAIDYTDSLGGGTVFIKSGTYHPKRKITLKSKISLIGEGPENTIINFTQTNLTSGSASLFSGAIEAIGTLVTQEGTGIVLTTASKTVDGTGTAFSGDGVIAGDILFVSYEAYKIASVEGDASLTLETIYQGQTIPAPMTYRIIRPINGVYLSNFRVEGTVQSYTEGIFAQYCKDFTIENVVVDGASRTGFAIYGVYNFRLLNCIATNNQTGISIDETSLSDGFPVTLGAVINCSSYNNSVRGMRIGSENMQVLGGNYSCNDEGIRLEGTETQISSARITENDNDGIVIEDSYNNKISNCSINANGADGISLIAVAGPPTDDDNIINGNTIQSNGAYGIDIVASANRTTISGNSVLANTTGQIHDLGAGTYDGEL